MGFRFMSDEYIHWEGKMRYGQPAGRCIYCSSDGGEDGLSDEHIVAYSLGADTVLPKASCKRCAAITSYVEGYASKEIFGPLRVLFGIQSRRKKVELNDVPVVFVTELGEETRMLPRAEIPAFLHLPILNPPGLFHEQEPSPITNADPWLWRTEDSKERMERFRRPGDKSYRFKLQIKWYPFARVLAKIAHTFAVARLGLDSFKPYLPDIILGKDLNAAYLIGGAAPPTDPLQIPVDARTAYHEIELTMMAAEGKPPIVVTTVRLFPFTGSPTYWVIVGEAGPSAIRQLTSDDPTPMPNPL
jgi:hypothetical protein